MLRQRWMQMSNEEQARRLWEQGTECLMDSRIDEAIELFQRSIEAKPTAEGYTYHGWALSFLGRLDEAIDDCKKAIGIDPEFGNPYNDIGVYLMQRGRLDEAIPWLERAKQARRYEPRHFPYANLGSIYERKGLWREAMKEYQEALRLQPGFDPALKGFARLRALMN
jgi:tetratricopeptide (TPR) repeat protein